MTNCINTLVQEAIKKGNYFPAKKDGKLVNFKPSVGMVAVFEDGCLGTVLKSPNGVGDFLIELDNGERLRQNICSGEIKGYIS